MMERTFERNKEFMKCQMPKNSVFVGSHNISMGKIIFAWPIVYFNGQNHICMGNSNISVDKTIFALAILIFQWAKPYLHGQF